MFVDREFLPHGSLGELVVWLIVCLDETQLAILGLVALFLQQMALRMRTDLPWKDAAKYLSCLFLFAYAWHLAETIDVLADVFGVIGILIRATLSSYLFYLCGAAPVVFWLHLVTRFVQTEWQRFCQVSRDLTEQYQRNRDTEPTVPPPASVAREVVLRRNSEQARLDYEFECQIIRSAGLDEDEQEAALTQAKQKYLQRLDEALR
ncbi:MAG: hypothetical protein HZA46_16015 [Planctomycetales bacterium]|nr:hypothetical protein [Planctomycetales bacterium]